MPVAAVVAVPVENIRIEAHVPRVSRIARTEGRRPIVAVGANTAEVVIEPVASGWKEDTVAIGLTGYFVPIDAVLGCPRPGTLLS